MIFYSIQQRLEESGIDYERKGDVFEFSATSKCVLQLYLTKNHNLVFKEVLKPWNPITGIIKTNFRRGVFLGGSYLILIVLIAQLFQSFHWEILAVLSLSWLVSWSIILMLKLETIKRHVTHVLSSVV